MEPDRPDSPQSVEDLSPASEPPRDKILCEGRYYRYVVACMSNCRYPHYCNAFWRFFESRGLTPVRYYNEGGIGEQAMRRIVIDCDRCGRRDIGDVFALYTPEGEGEAYLVPLDEQHGRVQAAGYPAAELWPFLQGWLAQLERERQWVHLCGPCFQKLCDCTATILNVKRQKEAARPDGAAVATLVPADEPDAEDPPADIEPVVPVAPPALAVAAGGRAGSRRKGG